MCNLFLFNAVKPIINPVLMEEYSLKTEYSYRQKEGHLVIQNTN